MPVHTAATRRAVRPTWDEYFLHIAQLVAKRATCLRRQVGAVIVKDKRILTTGYNGAPSSLAHCEEVGCLRAQLNIPSGQRHELCRALHAEMNAILQAAQHGIRLSGSVIYCTDHPCIICAKMIINAGITRVVVFADYPDDLARQILAEARVSVEQATKHVKMRNSVKNGEKKRKKTK